MTKRGARIVFDCRTANDPIDRVDGFGVEREEHRFRVQQHLDWGREQLAALQ